jgi:hypothetical protein
VFTPFAQRRALSLFDAGNATTKVTLA